MHPLLVRQPVLTRITANIGAQIDGMDLARRLCHAEVDLLRSAIAEHLVVIVRAQFLSVSQLADVAESFAPILHSPVHAVTGDQRSVSTIEDTPRQRRTHPLRFADCSTRARRQLARVDRQPSRAIRS